MRNLVVTPPTIEPVSVAELKSFMRVTHTHEDAIILVFGKGARKLCEDYARLSFLDQTRQQIFAVPQPQREYLAGAQMGGFGFGWPSTGAIFNIGMGNGGLYDPDNVNRSMTLGFGPVSSITAFGLAGDGVSPEAVDSDLYTLSGNVLTWNDGFADVSRGMNRGSITYQAGCPDAATFADTYPDIKVAIQMTTAVIYENRGLSDVTIPPAARQILLQYRPIIATGI